MSSMIGSDERTPRATRGEKGAPSRRAAAGMDQIDFTALDQLCEAPRIGKDCKRILARDRKLNDFSASLCNFLTIRPPSVATSVVAPARASASLISTVEVSAPPASRRGTTWRMVTSAMKGFRFSGWTRKRP